MTPTKAIPIIALALALVPVTAFAEYRYLCTSVPGSCEYAPPTAPVLGVDVCYMRSTRTVRLKGSAPCPTGSSPYYLKHGEVVDPTNGSVVAYSPLDDACDAGLCLEYAPHTGGTENGMCCENGGPCWPIGGCEGGGVLYWCNDGVTNQDGSIDCFDADEIPQP
jgi:hypothetical protein